MSNKKKGKRTKKSPEIKSMEDLLKRIDGVSRDEARQTILAVAKRTVESVKEGKLTPVEAEDIVFHPHMVFYCRDDIDSKDLISIISAGVEIDDAKKYLDHKGFLKHCDSLVKQIDNLLEAENSKHFRRKTA